MGGWKLSGVASGQLSARYGESGAGGLCRVAGPVSACGFDPVGRRGRRDPEAAGEHGRGELGAELDERGAPSEQPDSPPMSATWAPASPTRGRSPAQQRPTNLARPAIDRPRWSCDLRARRAPRTNAPAVPRTVRCGRPAEVVKRAGFGIRPGHAATPAATVRATAISRVLLAATLMTDPPRSLTSHRSDGSRPLAGIPSCRREKTPRARRIS